MEEKRVFACEKEMINKDYKSSKRGCRQKQLLESDRSDSGVQVGSFKEDRVKTRTRNVTG